MGYLLLLSAETQGAPAIPGRRGSRRRRAATCRREKSSRVLPPPRPLLRSEQLLSHAVPPWHPDLPGGEAPDEVPVEQGPHEDRQVEEFVRLDDAGDQDRVAQKLRHRAH